jgi:transcriptional regulator with XRE-family HTH domain
MATLANLPAALLSLRRRRGLTQTEVAKRVGTTAAVIGRYELGKQDPKAQRLGEMLTAMDSDVGDLWQELCRLNGHTPPAAFDPEEILRVLSEQAKRIRELEGKTDTNQPEEG